MSNILLQEEMELKEQIDNAKLKIIIDNFDALYDAKKIRQKDRVKNEITDKKAALTLIHEYYIQKKATDKVSYSFKKGISWGRMFSKKMSLQGLCKAIRHTIAKDFYYDLDIANAHPVILLKLCKSLKVETPVLTDLVENRDDYLADLMETYKIDRETAKAIPLAIINGGERADKMAREYQMPPPDWLISLQNEVQIIYKEYIKTEEGRTMKRRATDQSKTKKWINIEGSTINYHLCKMENEILTVIVRKLWDMKFRVGVFCFDGCMIYKDERLNDDVIRSLEEEVNDKLGYEIKLKIKEMDEAISLDGLTTKKMEADDKLVVTNASVAELYHRICGDEFVYTEEMGWFRLSENGKYEESGSRGNPNGLASLIRKSVEPLLQERKQEILDAQISDKGLDKLCDKMDKQIESLQSTTFMAKTTDWLMREVLLKKVTFDPSKPYGINGKELNLFEGFHASTLSGFEYRKELTTGFVNHINWICGGKGDFLLDWISQLIQRPEVKLPVTPIISSYFEGVGKDTIYEMIKAIVGEQYCVETADIGGVVDAPSGFNSVLHKKFLINFSEIRGKDTHAVMEKLKHAISCNTDNIMYKGKEKFSTPSFVRYFGSSNNPDMFFNFAEKQRRFWVTRINEKPKSKEYYEGLHTSLKDDETIYSLYHYFMNRDIRTQKFVLEQTEFMEELRQSCIPFHQSYLQSIGKGDLDENGRIPVKELYEKYSKHCDEMLGKKDAQKMTQTKFSLMMSDMGQLFGLEKSKGAIACKGTRCMAYEIDLEKLSAKLSELGLISNYVKAVEPPKVLKPLLTRNKENFNHPLYADD